MKEFTVKPGMIFGGGAYRLILAVDSLKVAYVQLSSDMSRAIDSDAINCLATSHPAFAKENLQPNSVYEGMEYVRGDGTFTVLACQPYIKDGRVNLYYKIPGYGGSIQDSSHDTFWSMSQHVKPVVEMTLAEVCKALNKTIKIVKD